VSQKDLLQKTSVEDRIDALAHNVLDRAPEGPIARALIELIVFGLKQAWACLFGALMLAMITLTALFYPAEASISRYDALFAGALGVQILMLLTRLENLQEAKIILMFHIIGTAMEVFKTHAGSWVYPEASVLRIAGVPLFSGFMYASVGSYIARIWRIFDMRFTRYPPLWTTYVLAALIYLNFFTHHYTIDVRIGLFALVALLFWRTRVHFRVFRLRLWMPMIAGFILVALFIWMAENIATLSKAWLYPSQLNGWAPVSLAKLGSWFLLMIISFVLVTLVHRPTPPPPVRV
jgi:uncharacterized membrane protein YoaT (DUF817 family)